VTQIVFTSVSDPIELRIVESLARPGGNATGISATTTQLMAKRLELLSEFIPRISTIALLVNPKFAVTKRIIAETQEAARSKDLPLRIVEADSEEALAAVFPALRSQADALVVGPDPLFYNQRQQIAALAVRHGVAAIYELRQFADAGGLISYGTSITGIYYQAAGYVGRILSGAKPADLPVQQPTRFELTINLKTAKALGLTVPQSLLARADEVIE
jgi:putative tryptophan/tyrosine transport system substrate-binding protein